MFVHLLFRLAPIAVRLIWLLLNGDLAAPATTKATLGATQVTALLPLDLEELQGYMHFWLVWV